MEIMNTVRAQGMCTGKTNRGVSGDTVLRQEGKKRLREEMGDRSLCIRNS